MKRGNKKIVQLSLYDEFDSKISTYNEGMFPAYKHFLFEIFYVLKGTGEHLVNNEKSEYTPDDLFILTPDAHHQFEVKQETTICIISFNEGFFSPNKSYAKRGVDFSEVFKKLEAIYYHVADHPDAIKFDSERELVRSVIHQLTEENEKKRMFYYSLMQSLMFILLSLIASRVQSDSLSVTTEDTGQFALDVIAYIQYHIYDNKKLSLPALSKTFGKTKDILLRQFRSATGKTIKEFIMDYKLSLVRSRLLFSDMPIVEIANELDFTDESHLNKMFKARLQITPAKFREMHNK